MLILGVLRVVNEISSNLLQVNEETFTNTGLQDLGGSILVDIAGAVTMPGIYTINVANARVVDAINIAGSFTYISSAQQKNLIIFLKGISNL